jgi:hypothetical protein
VAIGENANGFMSALAADGTCIFVEADHQVAHSAAKVVSRLATPAHRHARLVAEGLTEQAPHIAPDIYPDLVVRLTGRMARPAPGALVEVVGDDGVIAVASIELSADSSITTRWASSRIKALDADVMAARGAETVPALEKQITDLSIKHQVLSKYTAWIAVDRSRTTDTVIVRTIHQPDYGLFDDEPAGAMTHALSLSYLRYQLPVRSIGSLWELSVNPQSPGDQWDISFDSPDVDISAIKRRKADLDVPIGTLIAELRRLVNDASSTAADMQAVLKAIEFFLMGIAPNGLVKRVGVMRLKRLMAKCTTALQKGQIDTARALMLRLADYLNDAAPDSIF